MEFGKRLSSRRLAPALLTLLLATVVWPTGASAQVPRLISYQGTLTEDGRPVSDTLEVTFALFATRTGGVPLWTSEPRTIPVQEGRFSVLLGQTNDFPDDLFAGDESLYLQVQVGNGPPFPRLRLASTAYALRATVAEVAEEVTNGAIDRAALADGIINASKIASGAVTTEKLSGGAVTTPKLNGGAVTSAKISNGAIQASDIDEDAVGNDELDQDAVTGENIVDGAITSDDINNSTISSDDIDDGAVKDSELADDAAVTRLNNLSGPISLVAGDNITIETDSDGNTVTISNDNGVFDAIQPSSRRWKTRIEPLKHALGKVQQLQGVSFVWKESGRKDIGLIAEAVAQVVPEVVAYEDGGAQGLNYGHLVALLIEAVKAQQTQINAYRKDIEQLKARLARLERLVRSQRCRDATSPAGADQ